MLKVKLATAIVGISSIHLLQMFVNIQATPRDSLMWGTIIHMAFILSACILAYMAGPMDFHSGDIPPHEAHAPGGGPQLPAQELATAAPEPVAV
ncbi:hypothetical protein [Kitasatospora azatica]|uniref:hypothetical protein n=1 Tax=Kitasatospora azatica TaxID=58347 RepID=UPI00068FE891